MKILIADDDAVWVRVLSRYLAVSGHEVLSGCTWAEVRALADSALPDVLLLDSELPDGEAADFCSSLRSDPRFDRTALVLLSGVGPGKDFSCADRCLLKGEPMGVLVPEILAAAAERRSGGGK